jgi:hypothetical protein
MRRVREVFLIATALAVGLSCCGRSSAQVSTSGRAPSDLAAVAQPVAAVGAVALAPGCDAGAALVKAAPVGAEPPPESAVRVELPGPERLSRSQADALRIGDTIDKPLPWVTADFGIDKAAIGEWMPVQGGTGCTQIVGFVRTSTQYRPDAPLKNGPQTESVALALYDRASGEKVGWMAEDLRFHSTSSGFRPKLELRSDSSGLPVTAPTEFKGVAS